MVYGETNPVRGGYYGYEMPEYPGATSYYWEVVGGNATIFQNGSRYVAVIFDNVGDYEI